MDHRLWYLRRDPRVVALVELADVRTYLLVPLLKDDELIGALGINREQVQPFTDRQIDLVTDFAAQATIALRRDRPNPLVEEAARPVHAASRRRAPLIALVGLLGMVLGARHDPDRDGAPDQCRYWASLNKAG